VEIAIQLERYPSSKNAENLRLNFGVECLLTGGLNFRLGSGPVFQSLESDHSNEVTPKCLLFESANGSYLKLIRRSELHPRLVNTADINNHVI
jgi:hypothetical protein